IATARSPVTSTPAFNAVRTASRSASLALPSMRRCSAALRSFGPDVICSKEIYKNENLCAMVRIPTKNEAGRLCAVNTTPTLDYQPSQERMTIMSTHSSATLREIPHVNQTSRTNTIVNALKQRAQADLN